MAIAQWNEWYEVGIPVIDAQHQDLFATVNSLYEAFLSDERQTKVAQILAFLLEYAVSHFREEEALMEAHGDPGLPSHAEEHRVLLDQLMAFRDQFAATADVIDAKEFAFFLIDWLTNHIAKADMLMGAHLRMAGAMQRPQRERAADLVINPA